MKRLFKIPVCFLFALLLFCGCRGKETVPAAGETSPLFIEPPSVSLSEPPVSSASSEEPEGWEYPQVWEALHDFYWMARDEEGGEYADKPFLRENGDGFNGAAGVWDIDRDGELEFLLEVRHVPRGVPSVEVFKLGDQRLKSAGGFFRGGSDFQNAPPTLSYYRDKQRRLLLVQQTRASYGGYHETWIATDVANWKTFPVARMQSYYGENPEYFAFPASENERINCTNYFLRTGSLAHDDSPLGDEVSGAEYEGQIESFMAALTLEEEVPFSYSVYYNLCNGADLAGELRYEEIARASGGEREKYRSREELQKTSDMVAEALYKDYIARLK